MPIPPFTNPMTEPHRRNMKIAQMTETVTGTVTDLVTDLVSAPATVAATVAVIPTRELPARSITGMPPASRNTTRMDTVAIGATAARLISDMLTAPSGMEPTAPTVTNVLNDDFHRDLDQKQASE